MNVEQGLQDLYDDYYIDGTVAQKRQITARQTIEHIRSITNSQKFDSIIDIGAGEGSVVQEISAAGLCSSISAVEISLSGIETIQKKNIQGLKSLSKFDGYTIPHGNNEFDLGLSIHVVEHVEHERVFLKEAARVCKKLYVEVPLEHTINLDRAIQICRPYGHINYYTPSSFNNLVYTSGLKIEKTMIFPLNLELETFVASNALKGQLKHQIRKNLLRVSPKIATNLLVYMYGVLCSKQEVS